MQRPDASSPPEPVDCQPPEHRQVDEEIQFHLDMMTEFFMKRGLAKDEARRAAERKFGNLDHYRRTLIEARRHTKRRLELTSALSSFGDDLGYALRHARRWPGLAIGVAITIALGVGANATMFGVSDRILLRPPPHIQHPESVKRLYVERSFRGRTVVGTALGYPDFRDWDAAGSLQSTAAYGRESLTYGHGDGARRVQVVFVSAGFFPLLGVTPHRGRLFVPEDDESGASRVVVLGYQFWQSEFGANDDVIGRTVDIGPDRFTVVGVAPRGFTGVDLSPVEVWTPLHSHGDAENWGSNRNYYWIRAIARLGTDATIVQAAAEATALHRAGRSEQANYDRNARVVLAPLITARGPRAAKEFDVARWLVGVSLIVLIIACFNVANLLLAQGARRHREIAVRLALGVSRGRLMRQLLIESTLFGLVGAAGALAIAKLGGDLVSSVLLPDVDWSLGVINERVLAFTLVVALLTGLAAGVIPALQSSQVDLVSGLKSGGAGALRRRSRMRVALLVAQAALSVVLLVGAGLFVQSLDRVLSADFGFELDRLLVTRLEPEPGSTDRAARVRIHQRALERLLTLPVVQSASAVRSVPFQSGLGIRVRAEGWDSIPRLPVGGPYINIVTPGYFKTMQVRVLLGRGFHETDADGAALVAVVGETMAGLLWPSDNALGKCLYIGPDDPPCAEIVGIAEDVRRAQVIEDPQLMYYTPAAQQPEEYDPRAIFIRVTSDEPEIRATLRQQLYTMEPSLRFVTVNALADFVAPQLRSWRLGATVFSVFGLLALAVATVGLYSVLSFEVAQRRAEIGVRAALGASAGRLVRLVVTDGVRFIAMGVALGGAVAFFGSRALEPLLYETSPRDPVIYGLAAATMLAVAVAASLVPALRTTRVRPIEALKSE